MLHAQAPIQEPARERGLVERNRRVECTSTLCEVAWSDRDSDPAVQQADRRRAAVEYASLNADDVAGAIRLHREDCIAVDFSIHEGRDVSSTLRVNTAGVEGDERVFDEGMAAVRAARHIDAVLREIPDRAADNIDLFAGENAHAMKASPEPLDVEPFKHDPVSRSGIDGDPVRSRHQHTRFNVVRADGDRLGDGHPPESTRIENVDLARRRGLGDGACKRLARRRAAARIGVIANTGHPSSRRLCVCGARSGYDQHEREAEYACARSQEAHESLSTMLSACHADPRAPSAPVV